MAMSGAGHDVPATAAIAAVGRAAKQVAGRAGKPALEVEIDYPLAGPSPQGEGRSGRGQGTAANREVAAPVLSRL